MKFKSIVTIVSIGLLGVSFLTSCSDMVGTGGRPAGNPKNQGTMSTADMRAHQ